MKMLLIIVAVVALSFAAVLVYGVARPAPSTAATGPGSAPPRNARGDVDPDAMENWQPPLLLTSLGGLGRRYAHGIKLDPPQVHIPGTDPRAPDSDAVIVRRSVPAVESSSKTPRVANVTLVAGDAARVTAVGKDEVTACLCRPGIHLLPADTRKCSPHWISKQTRAGGCQADADATSFAFDPRGGELRFSASRPATVQVQ